MQRRVDDGTVYATAHCADCVMTLLQQLWGQGMTITKEEEGATIKFGDVLETVTDGHFHWTPYYDSSPIGPNLSLPRCRFVPFAEQLHPVRYVRVLLVGALHRVYQISGADDHQITRCVLELCNAIHYGSVGYPWHIISRATHGTRSPWATRTLGRLRALISLFQAMHT